MPIYTFSKRRKITTKSDVALSTNKLWLSFPFPWFHAYGRPNWKFLREIEKEGINNIWNAT